MINAIFVEADEFVVGVVADVPTDEIPPRLLYMAFPLPAASLEEYERAEWVDLWSLAPDILPVFEAEDQALSLLHNAWNLLGLLGPTNECTKMILSFANLMGAAWIEKSAVKEKH